MTLTVGGHPVIFILGTGATFSALLSNLGPPSTKSATIHGISGKLVTNFFTQQLNCNWDSILFFSCLSDNTRKTNAILGRDVLSKMQASIHMEMESTENLCLPLTEVEINPEVWATGRKIGRAISAQLVQITLKTPNSFPYQKQYPLKPETKQGLIPLIENLKGQGLLIECNSPYNTPILEVQKLNAE